MEEWIQEYISRFPAKNRPALPQFYTQLDRAQYHTYLPYLFTIEACCIRLFQALQKREKVCIYSDYDTDAVTATAVMYHGLIQLGFDSHQLDFYSPDRFVEGYGMNVEAVGLLSQQFDLIISVDCGINSVQEARLIQTNNQDPTKKPCDLIITDHHHLQDNVPECVAVINPRLRQYYQANPDKLHSPDWSAFFEMFDPKQVKIMQAWFQKVAKTPEMVITNPELFLPESVTGVGVAWFTLVWFGYFLEELGC